MNVICHHCKTKLTIPDHKLPRDKESSLKCPKCGEKIQIPPAKHPASSGEKAGASFRLSPEDRLNALICIGNDDLKKKALAFLRQMGFTAEVVTETRAALSKMEYHIYHLVVIDDTFDHNTGMSDIMARMNAMDMSLRRRICLVWISSKFNTNDDMAALHASVNAIIHRDDINHLDTFLSRALTDHKNFYTVYSGSLKQIGRS